MHDGKENPTGHDLLHIVRVSFETRSPLSVGSGERRKESRQERGSDAATNVTVSEIQRDANGLPTIPGAGLQGVLRRLAAEAYGEDFTCKMFGREDADGNGAAGRVACGWSCPQDANGAAVSGLRLPDLDTSNDDILRLLARPEPLWRDHVALNDRHAVNDRRKFARAAVPVGARFSVELNGWGDDSFRDDLLKVVSLFQHPRLRLGAGSGAGYGRIRLLAASYEAPSLDDATPLRKLREESPSKGLSKDLLQEPEALSIDDIETTDTVLTLSLQCTDLLRIGAAGPHARHLTHEAQRARCARTGNIIESEGLGAREQEGGDAILMLMREPRIVWDNSRGRVIEINDDPAARPAEQLCFPIPGSSIRGPLAHRMLFYANSTAGRCIHADAWLAETDEEKRKELKKSYDDYAERSPELVAFLGAAKESAESDDPDTASGQSGCILFDDAEVSGVSWIVGLDHVSIDRFTGGARDGALFREETLLGGHIEATATILRPPLEPVGGGGNTVDGWPEATAKAFLLAVHDLCRGRLALGGRGHGECSGKARFAGKNAAAWCKAAESAGVPIGETDA